MSPVKHLVSLVAALCAKFLLGDFWISSMSLRVRESVSGARPKLGPLAFFSICLRSSLTARGSRPFFRPKHSYPNKPRPLIEAFFS